MFLLKLTFLDKEDPYVRVRKRKNVYGEHYKN